MSDAIERLREILNPQGSPSGIIDIIWGPDLEFEPPNET